MIFPQVAIAARARIGEGTVVNRGALVGHHTTVGRYCFLGPGSNVAGKVTLGEQVYVRMGALVRDSLRVGYRVVSMGAAAVKDVPAGVTVLGVPARPVEPA